MSTPKPPDTYTVSAVADKFDCCTQTIRRRVHDGTIPAIRVGRLIRIPAAFIDDLAERGGIVA